MGKFKQNGQKGQILLVVVLAAVISLTVGLAAVSRTITNTKVSTEEVNSQKALSAAEAGVEQLVQDKTLVQQANPTPGVFSGNLGTASFKATVTDVKGAEVLINGGSPVKAFDGVDVWLSTYSPTYPSPTTTSLTLYWYDSDSDCAKNGHTAIEVVVLYDSTAGGTSTDAPAMNHYAYDKCATADANNFDSAVTALNPTTVIQGTVFNRKITTAISVTRGLVARIIPYSETSLAVTSSPNPLPAQGYIIDSKGTAGSTTRKIRAYQNYPKLPTELFPYSIFEP